MSLLCWRREELGPIIRPMVSAFKCSQVNVCYNKIHLARMSNRRQAREFTFSSQGKQQRLLGMMKNMDNGKRIKVLSLSVVVGR